MRIWSRVLPMALVGALATSLLAPISGSAASCAADSRALVVVKVDPSQDGAIDQLTTQFPVEVADALVPSRGIWELRSTDPAYCDERSSARKLAKQISTDPRVRYAEASYLTEVDDTRFHAWGSSGPADAGTDPDTWRRQPAATELRLDEVHQQHQGVGALVAVLDTGVDSRHPALSGVLVRGWDYVDDDVDASEVSNRTDDDGDRAVDESFGHGTFISGIVALVAPQARIMPLRVLDSDGRGNTFVVAQAIEDAVAAGADVISLSFGTVHEPQSGVFVDALKEAKQAGVVVVAAAGNAGGNDENFPAAMKDVVGVGALSAGGDRLTEFSGCGGWVEVAAPGERVAGPVPGGRYAWWNGTSVATPFVSGQLALLISQRGEEQRTKLVKVLRESARTIKPKGLPKADAIDIWESLAGG